MKTLVLVFALAGCSGPARSDAGADLDAAPRRDAGRDAFVPRPEDAGSDAGFDAGFSLCPSDMLELGTFCMDRFEAPNVEGALPLAMQSALAGEDWCAERGKRLCTEAEWLEVCNGPSALPYPYGESYERGRCNDDETWISPDWTALGGWPDEEAMAEAERLYQGEASGSNAGCVSEEGAYDLTGNVAEWVRRSFEHTNNYDHVMKGCYWAGCFGGSPPSCSFVNPAHPSGFRSYEAGFRCCTELQF
jgi:formylglycine-generating enzyme